jgi:hypothetical protein
MAIIFETQHASLLDHFVLRELMIFAKEWHILANEIIKSSRYSS